MEEETFNMVVRDEEVLQSNIPPINNPGGQLSFMGRFQASSKIQTKALLICDHSKTANTVLGRDTSLQWG